LISLSDVAATVAGELERLLNIPYFFFGHSLGAHICFEVARQLRRLNLTAPRHMFVSAARAPQLPNRQPLIHHLPDDDFLNQLARRFDGIPTEVLANQELTEIVLVPLRADTRMFETYQYVDESPLSCSITALGGEQDCINHSELKAWYEQTNDTFNLKKFVGGHFFLQESQDLVLQTVADQLERNHVVRHKG